MCDQFANHLISAHHPAHGVHVKGLTHVPATRAPRTKMLNSGDTH